MKVQSVVAARGTITSIATMSLAMLRRVDTLPTGKKCSVP